jgi:hypothetical protein
MKELLQVAYHFGRIPTGKRALSLIIAYKLIVIAYFFMLNY